MTVLLHILVPSRFNSLKHEARLNKTKKCSYYLKETLHVSMTTINWLILFRKIIAVYSENHTKSMNSLCGQNAELLIVKVGGTYSYH
jgi:hypothetical protein